jgi:hypothetical protein
VCEPRAGGRKVDHVKWKLTVAPRQPPVLWQVTLGYEFSIDFESNPERHDEKNVEGSV